jgi:hypothetical protein
VHVNFERSLWGRQSSAVPVVLFGFEKVSFEAAFQSAGNQFRLFTGALGARGVLRSSSAAVTSTC